jgi:hypothetical protein
VILGKRESLRRWVGPLLLLLLAGSLEPSGSTAAASSPPGPRVVRADAAGIEIEWIAPPLRTRVTESGVAEIEAAGYQQLQQPGLPYLPFTSTVIALPIDAVPHLRVLSTDEAVEPLSAPLAVAPRPAGVIRGQDGQAIGGDFAAANPEPGDWPSAPAALEDMGVVRGMRLARLVFYPVIPQGAALRVTRRLRVSIAWETPERHGAAAYIDPMAQAVQGIVINPWDVAPSTHSAELSVQHAATLSPTAYIEVESAGIYEVTYADLDDLGLAGANPHNLRLFLGTTELPIQWVGDTDTVFEAGEAIRFYAEPRFSRWTNVDAYRLIADASPGQRMAEVSASTWLLPEGVPWVEQLNEENLIYTPDCFCGSLPAGRDGDRWTWRQLRKPDLTSVSLPVQAAAVDTGQDAELILWFVSYTDVAADPDHRVDAALNGTPLGRVEWNGKTAITATLPITAGILHNGQNTLALTLPGIPGVSVEETWLDAFALRYARDSWEAAGNLVSFGSYTTTRQAYTAALAGSAPYRAYDVTDPLYAFSLIEFEAVDGIVTLGDPTTGPRRYIVVAAEGVLQPYRVRAEEDPWAYAGASAVNGADLLIITHPDFADELDPLVALRQSQGISTTVVNVLGIYDVWGDGRPDPETIRTFIAEAYATWSPRPLYVLLVGDGSYDPRQYRAESPPTFIPPYLADVDPWAGETAADNRYVCVDGSDTLPDLLLGRLPVESAETAQSLVNKSVQYDTDPSPGGWNADVLLVADDTEDTIDFAASSETYAAAHVSDPFTVTRFYCQGVSPYLNDCSDQETETIHANLVNDWNQGALLIQFTGHSSWQQWAVSTPSGKPLFHLDDVATLHNGHRLPVMLSMTCFTGAFHRPELTLDEELVTATNSGAVAAWGPTGLGVGTGHDHLSNGFFHAVFGDEVETVGEAILAGKLELSAGGVNLDLLDTFSLLGDPSLRLNRTIVPWDYVFLPLVQRNSDG